MKIFKELIEFIKAVANDPRIPQKDKAIVLGLVAYIISPVDFIPDWIPVIGLIDDMAALSLILDYFFTVLDNEILLSHYPWGMKSFARIRRIARLIALFTPRFVKDKIWSYSKDPYRS